MNCLVDYCLVDYFLLVVDRIAIDRTGTGRFVVPGLPVCLVCFVYPADSVDSVVIGFTVF